MRVVAASSPGWLSQSASRPSAGCCAGEPVILGDPAPYTSATSTCTAHRCVRYEHLAVHLDQVR